MAIARIDLNPSEVDWLVSLLPKEVPTEFRRTVREIKRAGVLVRAVEADDKARLRRTRAMHPQAS